MVQFAKLKLYGFKSFVDKTELAIGPGLNGIVGPNGCGKSNLVEALRWVMGEKSAKNMRGGGMEDVIFAGTSKRPARNMAEVTVVMNNEDQSAPAPFDTATEIEIYRRIEKDKGSQYRVNGKAVRARDVNRLFADTMTGASSPALVSQGRITEVITAKPEDRRRILEDSAGISGVHTRRHEAELRLRAAEQNLTRLNDSLNDMRSRLTSLKRQARQAERYKELSDSIRRLDMALLWCGWSKIHQKIRIDRQSFATCNDTVQDALRETKDLTAQMEALETSLPDHRKNVMEAQAVLQNFRVSLERLEQDIQTKAKGLQDAIDAKTQLEKDSDFTQDQYTQILADIEKASQDLTDAMTQSEQIPDSIHKAEEQLAVIQGHYDTVLGERQAMETALAVSRESQSSLEHQHRTLSATADKLNHNIAILCEGLDKTNAKLDELKHDEVFTLDLDQIESEIKTLTETSAETYETLQSLQDKYADHKNARDVMVSDITAMKGELSGLETLVARQMDDESRPEESVSLFHQLSVSKGYEKAVSSAFGQWLMMAGTDEGASVYWSGSAAQIIAPEGTAPLFDHVTAPAAVYPFLASVGFVETLPDSVSLAPGQMLVSRDGALMRWDGLTVTPEAAEKTDQAGLILEYKNRIQGLQADIVTKQVELDTLDETLVDIETRKADAETDLESLRSQKTEKENSLRDARFQRQRIEDQLATFQDKQTDQQARLLQNREEETQVKTQLAQLEQDLSATDNDSMAMQQSAIETLNSKLAEVSTELETARQDLTALRQAKATNQTTIETLKQTIEKYEAEREKLSARLDDFEKRHDTIEAKIRAYKTADDDDTDAMREDLLTKIAGQEERLRDLQNALESEEAEYKRLQSALRDAESKAANAREQRATAQANVANAEQDLQRLTDDIREAFELSPQALEERVFSLFNEQIPDLQDLESEKDTITRQRDSIGPVNLRAAIECQETETHLAEMENEYDDLIKAIEQLRGGIAKLNREAKERLDIAFQRVNHHFETLFTRLFDGGTAHLHMIQSDDPLESGL